MDAANLDLVSNLLEQDAEIRETIKDQVNEFDKKTRTMTGLLNKIHATPTAERSKLLEMVQPILDSCKATIASLAELTPENQFWRWKDMWAHSLRSAVFSATMVEYLRNGTLLSLQQVSDVLGIKDEWKERFALTAEDYLHGLISLINELSRLSVNSVTLGDFEEPLRISSFVKDLFAGFSMLNLKNDLLRRRFDSLKYDIKKIEEVVYDVSLRKLAPSKKDTIVHEG